MATIDDIIFGAYVHSRPDGIVFYVGKGTKKRAYSIKRNKYHGNIVEKYGKENIKIGFIGCSSEEIAFELEKGFIKCFRRMGIVLTNMTDGGEGCANPTSETRAKISSYQRGKKCKPRTKEHSINASLAQTGRVHSESTRAKISAKNKGKKRTEDQRLLMSIAASNKSEETKEKISISLKGKKRSAETRKKMSDSAFSLMTDEHRAKLSESAKAAWTIERRAALSESNKKRILSNETKDKIRNSIKKHNQIKKERSI